MKRPSKTYILIIVMIVVALASVGIYFAVRKGKKDTFVPNEAMILPDVSNSKSIETTRPLTKPTIALATSTTSISDGKTTATSTSTMLIFDGKASATSTTTTSTSDGIPLATSTKSTKKRLWKSASLQIFRNEAKGKIYQSLGFKQPSMYSLNPKTKIDNNVIDNYLLFQTQKASRATNIAFLNVQKIFNGIFDRYVEHHLADYDYIFLPANPGSVHWSLFTVDVKNRLIIYQDSMSWSPNQLNIESIKGYLNYLSRQQGGRDINWEFHYEASTQQVDGHNCGVFTLMNAQKRLFPDFQMPDAASAENFRAVIRNALQNEKV